LRKPKTVLLRWGKRNYVIHDVRVVKSNTLYVSIFRAERNQAMKKHCFVAKRMGWNAERDMILFDSNLYTQEEAFAQFKKVKKETLKNNHWYPYTAYEYNGVMYHDVGYLGIHDENNLPNIYL